MDDAPHRRLAAELRRRIDDGTYPSGGRVPSHRRLAVEYGVGVGTAYQAVAILRRDGLLDGRPGARLTVAYPPAVRTLTDPDAPWPHGTGDTATGTCRPTAELAARLQVPEAARLTWERTERLDPGGRPAMLVTTWRRGTGHTHVAVVCEVRPHEMGAQEAAALGLAPGTAALLVERTRLDSQGRPVQTADLVLPADRWRVSLQARRV